MVGSEKLMNVFYHSRYLLCLSSAWYKNNKKQLVKINHKLLSQFYTAIGALMAGYGS